MTRMGEELKLHIESLREGLFTGGGPGAAEPGVSLDAEQLAARIGATSRPADAAHSAGSAPWRKALKP